MKPLREDFSQGMPISAVGPAWFNGVARFINRLSGARGVLVNKDGDVPTISYELTAAGQSTNPPAQTGANISADSSGDAYLNPSGITPAALNLTSTRWTRGDTDGSGNKVGTKLTICTGIKKHPSQAQYFAHFANLTFDENGMLYKVETVKNFYRV